MLIRNESNPLITPEDLPPSQPDMEVVGAFNAGATLIDDKVFLLLRVAERPIQESVGWLTYPTLEGGEIITHHINRNDKRYELSDPRLVVDTHTGSTCLTSVSHLRLAWTTDLVSFEVEDQPWLTGEMPYENFGVEDPRITKLEDTYYINYTAVSEYGIATALLSTPDFRTIHRHGIMFPPSNRDVTIFPEKINGQYVCYHRPMPGLLGKLNMWIATSPDMVHWGNYDMLYTQSDQGWESGRVGGGAPPIKTALGWLSIYHAADRNNRYCLGAFLTALDDPHRIIGRSKQPILWPEADYEMEGFFGNVVFTCGAIIQDAMLHVYYGASDDRIALASAPLQDVLDILA